MTIRFTEGQLVTQGMVLAEIDPRAFQVQLAQAEGQLARDSALLDNARIDAQRYRTLFKQDSIARQQVDTQEALVRQYEGVVKSDRSQVDNARLQLDYARITAPVSGRIGLRQIDAGNMVRAGDVNGLAVINQVQPIFVVFTLPEDELPRVQARLKTAGPPQVEVYDRAQKAKLATGALATIDNQIDATTGTFKLKAVFANQDDALFPNQFVNARLLLEIVPDAVIVPASAVQRAGQDSLVYVVGTDNKVGLRKVVTGPADGSRQSIASGLAAGEFVVVDGGDRLRDGSLVTPSEPITQSPERRRPAGQQPSGQQRRQPPADGQEKRPPAGEGQGRPRQQPTQP
jgi:multidrug efflux system membrane fusion protein